MGGGGSYYDRDVSDRDTRTSRGTTRVSENAFSSLADSALFPKGRELDTRCAYPLVFAADVTGSMDTLPRILFDKMPNIVGQIMLQAYVDPEQTMLSFSAVGDAECDSAPIQVCNFSPLRGMDSWMKRVWIEGGGGGSSDESYELMAWYYANRYNMESAVCPIFLFTGDEGFRSTLSANMLSEHFGGQVESTSASEVFKALIDKFMGNVFLLHRRYKGDDAGIMKKWRSVLSDERIIVLPEDLAVGDLTIGIIALASGSRTLDQYCEDMRNRKNVDTGKPEPQSKDRINMVRSALVNLEGYLKKRDIKPAKTAKKNNPDADSSPPDPKPNVWRPSGKRPGRI